MKLGIDLGGTKIEILALDVKGEEIIRRRIATPRGSYPAIINALGQLVESVEQECGHKGSVGIGIPGAIDPDTALVKNANTTELIGQALQRDLEKVLDRPVRIANDANCFALSEAWDGAGAGATTVFGIILGTGCGGAIVFNQQVLVGPNAIAGEWGHNRLPDHAPEDLPFPSCYCGKVGCIETYVSGTGLARDFTHLTGRKVSAQMITQAAEVGDVDAIAALRRLELRLAKSLAVVVNILDPDVIVAGGGLSNYLPLYEHVTQQWAPFIFSPKIKTRFVPAKYGDSSGVRGAAHLWSVR